MIKVGPNRPEGTPGRKPDPRPTKEPYQVPGARWIPLTRGEWALVDEEDFEELNRFFWHKTVRGYAGRWDNRKLIPMHRQILETHDEVDHINRNPLDNRKANLRPATSQQNKGNQRKRSTNTSGYKGVTWVKRRGNWMVRVGKRFVGYFDCPVEAAKAYDVAAEEYFGEYAATNFGKNKC